MKKVSMVVVWVWCFSTPAFSTEPKTWSVRTVESWNHSERDSVRLSSDGRLTAGMAETSIDQLRVGTVWDLNSTSEGVWVATGDSGSLFFVANSGEVRGIGQAEEPQLTAVGFDQENRVLAGGAPGGGLYRVQEDQMQRLTSVPEDYVWKILPHPEGGAVIATGNPGRLYRFHDGNLQLLADPEVQHITGMIHTGGAWVATTDSPGRVLRITEGEAPEVLYEAVEPELRAPVLAEDGSVFFLANPQQDQQNGLLYRLNPNGAVEVIWVAPQGLVHTMEKGINNDVWVSSAQGAAGGRLYRIEPGPPSVWTEFVQVAEPEITDFTLDRGFPAWWSTGSIGRLYQGSGPAPHGVVTSPAHDAGGIARWGTLRLEPGPGSSGVSVETRTGNTRIPDSSWSLWIKVRLDGNTGKVSSPQNRYLQWRVRVTEGAQLTGIHVVYLPANRGPRITELAITELGVPLKESFSRAPLPGVVQELPGGLRVDIQRPVSNGQPNASPEQATWARRYRTVTFRGADPNGDQLRFTVQIRGEGESLWRTVVDDLSASPYIWDSSTVPDGWYQIRIQATDLASNSEQDALTADRMTEVFPVDNTPPAVSDLGDPDGYIEGVCQDGLSPLRMIQISIDGGAWVAVSPVDGITDSKSEQFKSPLPPGSSPRIVQVRCMDAAGNIGVGRLVLE